jgi:hypothetical protein
MVEEAEGRQFRAVLLKRRYMCGLLLVKVKYKVTPKQAYVALRVPGG